MLISSFPHSLIRPFEIVFRLEDFVFEQRHKVGVKGEEGLHFVVGSGGTVASEEAGTPVLEEELVGKWISYSDGGWYWSPSEVVKSTVSFNADSTWLCKLYHTPEGGSENFFGEAKGKWDVATYRPDVAVYSYKLYVSQVYCIDKSSGRGYTTYIPSSGKDYAMTYMKVDFGEDGKTMRINDTKMSVGLVENEHPNWDATNTWLPFNYQVDYTRQEE